MPIYVDCTQRDAHAALKQKYGVRGYPTVLFCDPEGKPVAALGAREPAEVKKQIDAIVARFQGAPPPRPRRPGSTEPPPPSEPSASSARVKVADAETLDEGLEKAREKRLLLAVIYTELDEARRDEHTEQVVQALRGRGFDQLPERFLWVRRPLCDDLGLPTPEADANGVTRSPTVALFDPWAEAPAGRTPAALARQDDLKALRAALERGTLEAARAGHPPPKAEERR